MGGEAESRWMGARRDLGRRRADAAQEPFGIVALSLRLVEFQSRVAGKEAGARIIVFFFKCRARSPR